MQLVGAEDQNRTGDTLIFRSALGFSRANASAQ